MQEADPQTIISFLAGFITDHKRELMEKVLAQRTKYLTVALEDIYQPHNASAVVRTADCFGIQEVHVIEGRNSYEVNPQVLRGSEKWVDIIKHEGDGNNTEKCFKHLKRQGYRLVGTTPHVEGHALADYTIDQPTALVFGTEETGLSDYALDEVDDFIRIPMQGFTESFNLSVSAAICLYQLSTMLHAAAVDWRLTEEEKEEIRLVWYKKVVRRSESLIKEHILEKKN